MAVDLLNDIVHYDLKNKWWHAITPQNLQKWLTHGDAYAAKKVFVLDPIIKKSEIYQSIISEFKGVWDKWVIPLHKLFHCAFNYEADQKEENEEYIYETINGKITFEEFMAAISERPQGLE
ncbi:hypothetical protein CPB84DRAFT_1852741 [Gymnopilus junonius]|uniref:Uncharacterized protein n=1 Tax=Gymnopilus junonius TaxID=109634 RepID=A0A9P5TG83_GYMJU|nr:hypothetical protein CPB84DRAFT_1852741 [Gymnopilus junonius]